MSTVWLRRSVVLIFVLGLSPSLAKAVEDDSVRVEHGYSKRYISNGLKDLKHVATAPAHWNGRQWRTFALISGGVVATSFVLDKNIRDLSQRNRNRSTDDSFRVMNSFGKEVPFAIEGAFYVGGELFKDDRAKACGLDGLAASVIAAGFVSEAIKAVTGRERPFNNNGEFRFKPFSRHDSFPSGHTTNAFALATVISSHYHNTWVRVGCYTVATLVAYARVDYDVHFASDVLAGGAIGFAVGKSVVALNRELRKH